MATFAPKTVAGTGARINALRKFNGIYISFATLYTPRVFTGNRNHLAWFIDHILRQLIECGAFWHLHPNRSSNTIPNPSMTCENGWWNVNYYGNYGHT
tara:strand:+ start:99 stop:392 length:294 start_codon:yes stop_codon:yes gene_type:complete